MIKAISYLISVYHMYLYSETCLNLTLFYLIFQVTLYMRYLYWEKESSREFQTLLCGQVSYFPYKVNPY
jgi:hypothetical protein